MQEKISLGKFLRMKNAILILESFQEYRDFPGYWKNYPKDANGKYDKP